MLDRVRGCVCVCVCVSYEWATSIPISPGSRYVLRGLCGNWWDLKLQPLDWLKTPISVSYLGQIGSRGGWKLVISDSHGIAISATWWHNCTSCIEGQVKARSPAMALDDGQSSLKGFPRNHSNASLIMKDYSRQSRAHLAVYNWVLFQTSEGAVV